MANLGNRIVVLVDMDCFFCQVETRLKPEYTGKPLAVVQYNQWQLGGIIAVNYEARAFGVTRHMRGNEAKEKCPELLLASVPCLRGKADTSRYRSAGREVIDVLKKRCNIVERASVDEAYLDITQIVDDKLSNSIIESEDLLKQLKHTYIVGHSENGVNDEDQRSKGIKSWLCELSEDLEIQRLSIAAAFVEELRNEIFETTTFKCSAGISFNKILAKLACGLHKPNCQTILPASAVPDLYGTLPIKKIRNLGGKLGDIVIDSLECNVMADLLPHSLQYLQNRFDEKTGLWLYNIARGIDTEPVTSRLVSKSIGACKNFPGKQALVDIDTLKHWIGELCSEVCERLEQDQEENERRASLLTVSFHYYQNKTSVSQSRSCTLTSYNQEKMAEKCLNIVLKATQRLPVSYLGVSASKFIQVKGSENFMNFFKKNTSEVPLPKLNSNVQQVPTDSELIDSELNESSKSNDNNVNNISNNEETNSCEIETNNDDNSKSVSSKKKDNRKSSPCSSIQKSLKSDNFHKSFFMNILKEKQSKRKLEMIDKETEDLQSNVKLSEDLINNKEEDVEENMDMDTSSTSNLSYSPPRLSHNNDLAIRLEDIFPDLNNIDPSIVDILPIHLQEEAKKFINNKEEDVEKNRDVNTSSTSNLSYSPPRPSNKNDLAVRLEDIFPDLNNIDPSIVQMLPINLQEEAKKYIKINEIRNSSTVISKTKNKGLSKVSKDKCSKSKSTNSKLKIEKFFIKKNENVLFNDQFKKCLQCEQLILLDKFEEHSDYHVANNLQNEMNRLNHRNSKIEINNR